ncbi:MAG: NAD-dependent epimerase/dehydratase family protein, partial [Candidatus Bathyarchaeia archaeon]
QPLGPYCIGKIGGELYVKYMVKTWDFPAVILRPFNTIGAMRRRTVVESVVWQMMEGGTLKLGDPASIRDFLWIQDHVNSYLKCLENDKSIGEVFNLCTGRGVSIENLVKIASEITGWNGQVLWNQFKPRINDIYCLIGSYGKAERMLGWKPTVTLEEAIKRMYEAWRK